MEKWKILKVVFMLLFNHEMCLSIIYSGDIDALILHMFTLSYLWPRDCNDEFKHEVFLLLVKPTTKDLYNSDHSTARESIQRETYGAQDGNLFMY